MEKPLVSISLVTYNQEAYIRQAIEGCLMQQVDFDYEILIHDDASSDSTPDIIVEYAQQHPDKIIPIIQSENQFSKGTEINAKIVIPRARGKYISFLEGDDYWIDPLKLQKQVDFMETHPETAMCFTASKHIYSDKTKKPWIKRYRNHNSICSEKDVILIGGRLVDMGAAVVKRSIFDDLPEWYSYAQIWDLSVPLLSLLHGEIYYLNEVTSVYRYNTPGSWTQNNVKNYDRRRNNLIKSVKLTESFDEATDRQYHRFIERKHGPMFIEILLLSTSKDEEYDSYYSKLSWLQKLQYHFFNSLGSFRLWEIMRQFTRFITGY